MRPHLGDVERVVGGLLRIGLGHDLHAELPARELAAFDGLVEIALRALAVLGDDGLTLAVRPGLDALHGLEVELDPEALVRLVDERVGMRAEAVHEAVALRQAAIREQDRDLVQALGAERPEIPHGGRRAQVRGRMALLRADEVGELDRVAHEEHRRVVADDVPVALVRIEFQREAAHVALGIRRAALAGDGREAQERFRLLADLGEDLGLGISGDVVGDGQRAIGRRAFGMNHALRDALPVLVRELLDQLVILEQQRAARAGRQAVLVIGDRRTCRGGHGRFCHSRPHCVGRKMAMRCDKVQLY